MSYDENLWDRDRVPPFLRNPDRSWRNFTETEKQAIARLRQRYPLRPLADRDTAAVPLLNDKGEAYLVKLTIDLVEPHAIRYWRDCYSEQFSFPADEGD